MQISEILKSLDEEISRLEQVRDLLANKVATEQTGKRRGRPKGSLNKLPESQTSSAASATSNKRQMSEEGRARIAEAQRRRWAATKQASEPVEVSSKKAAKRQPTAKQPKTANSGKPSSRES